MIAKLKALVLGREDAGDAAGHRHANDPLQLATAALLVEAACLDGHFDEAERAAIAALLEAHFHLQTAETDALIDAAKKTVENSGQLYAFTRVIRDHFSDEERVRMIEMLWEVAYADGTLHDYESALVRRVAGLIYVPDRESGAAHKRVRRRLEAAGAAPS